MPVFEWTGLDAKGKSRKGAVDAENERTARARLRGEGVFLTTIAESTAKAKKAASGGRALPALLGTGIPDREIVIMTRLLSNLLKAAIPIVEALTAIIDQVENPAFKRVLSQIRDKVNEGDSLSNALREHPRVFTNLYVNMVSAGEVSGTLDVVMARLAEFTEASMKLSSKVRGAMAYPVFMLIFVVLIVAFLFAFVIPKVTKMLTDLKATLPAITKALIAVSTFVRDWWWLVLGLIVLGTWLFRRWLATPAGRYRFDGWMLRAPVLGELNMMIAVARFSKTLATLLRSSVPVLTSLDIVKNIIGNTVLVKVLEEARDAVREGESLAGPLKRAKAFPPIVTHMIAVGERSGNIEEMLDHVASIYEVQVESQINALTSLLEPVIILVMGGVVVFIVLAIMLPILNLTSSVKM